MVKLTVKEVAEARGFPNAKQLADAAGIRYKSIYPIWNGEAKMIALDTLNRLCRTLKVPTGLLLVYEQDFEVESSAPASTRGGSEQAKRTKSKSKSKREARTPASIRAGI